MSGYREHSFDPEAFERAGPPMRPYNWVQWCGVAFVGAAIATLILYFAGLVGLIAPLIEKVQLSTALAMIGVVLIGSRREPGTWVGSEHLHRNRKIFLITIAVLAVVLVAAIIIESKGA
jgi:hypothetical protein